MPIRAATGWRLPLRIYALRTPAFRAHSEIHNRVSAAVASSELVFSPRDVEPLGTASAHAPSTTADGAARDGIGHTQAPQYTANAPPSHGWRREQASRPVALWQLSQRS